MLDEDWTSIRLRGDAAWIDPLLDAIDRSPPTGQPAVPAHRRDPAQARRTYTLFLFGRGDPYLRRGRAPSAAKVYAVEGRTRTEVIPGGHRAVFLAPGVEAIAAWIASLPPPETSRPDR